MTRQKWFWTAAAGVALLAAVVLVRNYWTPGGAVAQAPTAGRAVPVEVGRAERKNVPVTVESLGSVTPIASVALKSRLETVITGVHFTDGAQVKRNDLLFTLDGRQIEAEIKRVEAVIAGATAQLEQAERDVARYKELIEKNATTQVALNNSQTQVNIARATAESNRATLENLKVQFDYTKIRAPISGRMSAANFKVGNFVRPADTAPLATIIQVAPIYLSFTVPQRVLPDVRQALNAETATVEGHIPGDHRRATGQVTMIENTVDTTTGMVVVRASMPNEDLLLWPGTLIQVKLTLRSEDAVTVPSTAVQVSQSGSFVFIIENGEARKRPIKVSRIVGPESVIEEGLKGGETIVTDGQLLLSDGTKVTPRRAGAGA